MARYATTVRSERPAPVAFAFVADLSNLPQWDPGVQKVSQIRGDGLGTEAAYEVVLSSAGNTRLVYEMTEFDHEALTATLVATHSWFRSIDTISATGGDDEGKTALEIAEKVESWESDETKKGKAEVAALLRE